jgi:hypothetical protein
MKTQYIDGDQWADPDTGKTYIYNAGDWIESPEQSELNKTIIAQEIAALEGEIRRVQKQKHVTFFAIVCIAIAAFAIGAVVLTYA